MYFDAVVDNTTGSVVFNSTPEKTKEFVEKIDEQKRRNFNVFDGATLVSFTIKEYLSR